MKQKSNAELLAMLVGTISDRRWGGHYALVILIAPPRFTHKWTSTEMARSITCLHSMLSGSCSGHVRLPRRFVVGRNVESQPAWRSETFRFKRTFVRKPIKTMGQQNLLPQAPRSDSFAVPASFRDDAWSQSIGPLQRRLDALSGAEGTTFSFDFSNCRWIDPLPALSLLIEMARIVRRGVVVTASFAGPEGNSKDRTSNSSAAKLLLFLAKEGFLQTLLTHGVIGKIGNQEITAELIRDCLEIKATLTFSDASAIPMRLFDVPALTTGDELDHASRKFAGQTVAAILGGVEPILRSRCSAPERRHLLYTLRAVLQEFLHNVQEHAYASETYRPAALYVRFRRGLIGLASPKERNSYGSTIEEERKHSLQLSADWLHSKRGCLEVFFLDRGVGISQKFAGSRKDETQFRHVMESTFFDGRSSKGERTTAYGGLHLLHTLLSRCNDYLRAIEGSNWFGSPVPFRRRTATATKPIPYLEEDLIGFGYQVRLSWKAPTDDGDKWLRFSDVEVQRLLGDVLVSPSATSQNPLAAAGRVVDERFRDIPQYGSTSDHAYLLWLPPRNLMKWDVIDRLEKLAATINFFCTLVIADIPSIEAATYEAAISKADFNPNELWPSKFKAIVLATNRWSFAYAEYKEAESSTANGVHGFSPISIADIPKKFKPGLRSEARRSFRDLVVDWLKVHDSECFWRQAETSKRLFLPENVIWEQDEKHQPKLVIDGYLDFPTASHDRYCAALFRNALGRILNVLGETKTELVPVDSLAAPVVHEVYANETHDRAMHGDDSVIRLAVGSVLVSGVTLRATGLAEQSIHFFVHKDSPLAGKCPTLFHWMPASNIEKVSEPQKRIGRTSAIAPEGWLSIEVPRHHDEEALGGGRLPEKTYEDWQSQGPVIVKAGHWCYENHHDFLTINIPDAVDDAFRRNGPLAQFLVHHVLYHLGVPKEALAGMAGGYPKDSVAAPGIVVYRSHPSSERILERMLGVLPDSVRSHVAPFIFPILPLRMRWGSSTLLIPPRMQEEIRDALKTRPRVMVFDDAAISGRTIQDLMTALRALGAKEITIVAIANRLRLPAETGTVKYFWRLDVPTMGREGNCPLCQAIDAAKSFSKSMIPGSEAHKDLLQWINAWSAASPLSKWDAGLDPLSLGNVQLKQYCYSPREKRYLAQIPISQSTGLMIHAAELHAMTAIDNYGLKKIHEQDDPAIRIGLAASQLLLFGDELDSDLIRDLTADGLLVPMSQVPNDSPYGALAALVLMKVISTVSDAVKSRLAERTKTIIGPLSASHHGQILIAFLVSQRIFSRSDDACYSGIRLLSTRHQDLASKLRSLFRETVSPAGNIHSEPIPRLRDVLKGGDQHPDRNLLCNALASIASLRDIVAELGTDIVLDGRNYAQSRTELEFVLNIAEQSIRNLLGEDDAAAAIAVTKNLAGVQQALDSFSDHYFCRISPQENPKGRSFELLLEDQWKNMPWAEILMKKNLNGRASPVVRLSSDSGCNSDFGTAQWIWIPWLRQTRDVIRDLLMNSIYASCKIPDPWVEEGELADMWVHVLFEPQCVCISLANIVDRDRREVFEETKRNSKGKTRWDIFDALGGEIQLGTPTKVNASNVLTIELKLPYAGFLGAGQLQE